MPRIEISGLTKRFGSFEALKNVDLLIEEGSFTTLLGPSGCGKTTLLRTLSGLEEPDAGVIASDERVLFSAEQRIALPPKDRAMGLVFQSYALWPHMTVFQNIAYGLHIKKVGDAEVKRLVGHWLGVMGMEELAERYPSELSGGQQQRVSIARMLAMEHRVLLMDEPLSNLDAKLRLTMRAELKRLHQETGLTIVYVTHDQTEAMTLSTKIAVMNDGEVQHYGTPREVYGEPANLFVANFIGNPTINLVEGRHERVDGASYLTAGGGMRVELIADGALGGLPDGLVLAVRPEDLEIDAVPGPDDATFIVDTILDNGPDAYVNLTSDGPGLMVRAHVASGLQAGDRVAVRCRAGTHNLFDADARSLALNVETVTFRGPRPRSAARA